MNYKKHYNTLILKSQHRTLNDNIYFENHHIKPKCLGGNNKENLVKLLPEEHITAHLLLRKIYPGNKKILFAVYCMLNGLNKCSKKCKNIYEYKQIKEEISVIRSKEWEMVIIHFKR